MKEIEKAIMNEIIFLRMQGLSDTQVKLFLEQDILKGLINASKLSPNSNLDQRRSCPHTIGAYRVRQSTITNQSRNKKNERKK